MVFVAVHAYKQTDQDFLAADNNQNRDAGSTASIAVLVGDRFVVTNVGGFPSCHLQGRGWSVKPNALKIN
jgi:hypothetical protein